MKKMVVVIAIVLLGLSSASRADLTFAATYDNGLNADYAAGNGTATVTHGTTGAPAVGTSAAGTGYYSSSTPNKALSQMVGYVHSSNPNTGETVMYQAQNNMSLTSGTFVAWTKFAPFNTEAMFTPAEEVVFAENGHWSSNNSMSLYAQYYYSYKRDYLLAGHDAYGNYFYVNTMPTGETFDSWVFTAGSWNLSADGHLDLKLWVRPTSQTSFSTGTSSYDGMEFVDLDQYAPLNIGSDYWGSRIFGGLIDGAQIYNTALSDSQIAALYASTVEVVPEPITLTLLGLGFLAIRRK